MRFTNLKQIPFSRSVISSFKGYNHNLCIGAGEFYDMKNMTGDYFPVLSPRGRRLRDAARNHASWDPTFNKPQAMLDMNGLCFLNNGVLYLNYDENNHRYSQVNLGLSLEEDFLPKKLVKFGSYIIVLPDKKYFNTVDPEDKGEIEQSVFSGENGTVFPFDLKNEKTFMIANWSDTAPENPSDGDYWVDTSAPINALMQYSAADGLWHQRTSYLQLRAEASMEGFQTDDWVIVSCIGFSTENAVRVVSVGENYVVVEAPPVQMEMAAFTVSREMPQMDFVFEHENRLWGCRYGKANNGQFVNEIYASKLGDFKNWNSFQGVSTDSYVASCGTDGPWTGAIKALGYPLFFKENYLHKVYGSYPANYQIQTIPCRGVQEGCEKSLAAVNEVLFYKSLSGVCAYDGSLPVCVSENLGRVKYSEAVAGGVGNKYYISMKDDGGDYHLFCFDTQKGFWHREDNLQVDEFCTVGDELFYIENNSPYIRIMPGGVGSVAEKEVSWYAETGVIGTDDPDHKYISRITVRMSMAVGTRVRFLVEYDSTGNWESLASIAGRKLDSFTIPLRPKRCDHLRLRMEGEGDAKIYAITLCKTKGSDLR